MTSKGQSFHLVPPYVYLDVGVYNTLSDKIVKSVYGDKSLRDMTNREWKSGLARTAFMASYYCENIKPGAKVMNPSEPVTYDMLVDLYSYSMSLRVACFETSTLAACPVDVSYLAQIKLDELLQDETRRQETVDMLYKNIRLAKLYYQQANLLLASLYGTSAESMEEEPYLLYVYLAPVVTAVETFSPTSFYGYANYPCETSWQSTKPVAAQTSKRAGKLYHKDEEAPVKLRDTFDVYRATLAYLQEKKRLVRDEVRVIETKPLVGWNKYWHNQKQEMLRLIDRKLLQLGGQ